MTNSISRGNNKQARPVVTPQNADRTVAPAPTVTPTTTTPAKADQFVAGAQAVKTPAVKEVAKGTVRFDGDWNEAVQGELRAGGKLNIEYDPARTQLHHTHNGFPAWGVTAYVKFFPSGDVVEKPAIEFVSVMGRPTNTAKPSPFTVDIPAKAERVEVWFRNWSGADRPAEVYDSNYGKNYSFDVKK